MASLIGALRISLGLETATFERDVNRASGKMDKLTTGLGAAAGVMGGALAALGLSNLVGQAFDFASALSEDAEKLGLTAEGLQELRLAAQQNGVENDQLATSLTKLNRSLGDLALGKKAAVDAFAAIGLSAADLKGKNPQQALNLIADALNKLPDPQQRVAIGAQIMGKSFAQLLPMLDQGSKGLDAYAEKSRQMGEVSDENAKKLDELHDHWNALKQAVLVATANVVGAVIPMAEKVGATLDSTKAFFAGINAVIVGTFKEDLAAIVAFATGVKTWLKDTVGGVIDWLGQKFAWLRDQVAKLPHDFAAGTGKMHASFTEFTEQGGLQLASFGRQAEAVSVRVQQSFKDMAEGVLGALNTLQGSIKSGGFLGILSAVVGLGLQLGSTGLFGSTIAGRINGTGIGSGSSVPAVNRGGPISVASFGGSGGGGSTSITVNPSPYFNVVVDHRIGAAAPSIASASAAGAVQQMRYTQTRQLV